MDLTKFSDWFAAQFGERREISGYDQLRLEKEVEDGIIAQRKLDLLRAWDMRREAALTAWLAKENIANK